MNDLTSQWKKGELPEGHYYVKDGENMIAEYLDGYFYNNGEPMTSFSGGVDEVLAKVPSYAEWRNINKTAKDIMGEWNDLLGYANRLTTENAELKKLLKKCRPAVEQLIYSAKIYKLDTTQTEELLTKIDEVLNA